MRCPGCGLELEGEQENAQWLTCAVCHYEGHPVDWSYEDDDWSAATEDD